MEAWLSNPPLMGDAFGQPGTGHITRGAGGMTLWPTGALLCNGAVTGPGPTVAELLDAGACRWFRGQLHLTISVRQVGQTAPVVTARSTGLEFGARTGNGGTAWATGSKSIGCAGDDMVSWDNLFSVDSDNGEEDCGRAQTRVG